MTVTNLLPTSVPTTLPRDNRCCQTLVFSSKMFSTNTPTTAFPSLPGVHLAVLTLYVSEVTQHVEGFSVLLGSGGSPVVEPQLCMKSLETFPFSPSFYSGKDQRPREGGEPTKVSSLFSD